MNDWVNKDPLLFPGKKKEKKSPEELMALLAEAKAAIDALPEVQKALEEKASREKLEQTITETKVAYEASLKEERQKLADVKSALESQILDLKSEVKSLSARAVDSSKLQKRLDEEHQKRLQAEANLRVLENIPKETPQQVDFNGLANTVAQRLSPMIPRNKRGQWDFEIVRDGDGHISRVKARPS